MSSSGASLTHRLRARDAQLSFVPADPPRRSWLALWGVEGSPADSPTPLTLALPELTDMTVERIDMAEAIEVLRHDDCTPVSASVRYARAVLRAALIEVSQGRFRPGVTPRGHDAWQLTAFDRPSPRMDTLAAAMPTVIRACPVSIRSGTGAMLASTATALADFSHAIVDTLARTPAMASAVGHDAFAGRGNVIVDHRAAIASQPGRVTGRRPRLTIRLVPIHDEPGSIRAELVLQDRDDPSWMVPFATLHHELGHDSGHIGPILTESTQLLQRAIQIWPRAAEYLMPAPERHAGAHPPLDTSSAAAMATAVVHRFSLTLSPSQVHELMSTAAPQLGAMGLSVLAPRELFAPLALRPDLRIRSSAGGPSTLGVDDLRLGRAAFDRSLELGWAGEIGGIELTEEELERVRLSRSPLVSIRGQWVRIDQRWAKRLSQRQVIEPAMAVALALGLAVEIDGEVIEVPAIDAITQLRERLDAVMERRDQLSAGEIPPEYEPGLAKLAGTLRPYQRRGLRWLLDMDDLGLGGILADDMGLGKTIQIIALHLCRAHRVDAMDASAPTLVICPTSLLGNWEREVAQFAPGVPVVRYHGTQRRLGHLDPHSIVLTSYGVARRDVEVLAAQRWGVVVADEAQAMKNPASRLTRAIRLLGPDATRFALSGTPIQNRLSDLWALLDWTTPGLLGSLHQFQLRFATPIERDNDAETAEQLNRIISPFLLRRRKSDPTIAPELPPKTETDQLVPLSAEQIRWYQAAVEDAMAGIAGADGFQRRGLVLSLLTKLKQICDHPALFLGEEDKIDDSESRSGKLRAATELLEVIHSEGESTLVFTQFVAMAHLLERHWRAKGFRTALLHGAMTPAQRDAEVDRFQRGDADVFIVSLRAGGVGLNLTAASHVIHFDRWWNPAVEDQASDRAWRIGQTKPVQIHRLICEGTIEDKIAALINRKRHLADSVVSAGESWITELSDQELTELVSLGSTPDR